jgi:cell division protein FtsZ
MPGADYQVPIRSHGGRSMNGRGSDAMPSFASEEREARQAEAAQQMAMPLKKNEAETERKDEGLMKAGRIWVSTEEMDDGSGSDDAMDEGDFEEAAAEDSEEMMEADEVEREPELVPVSASVFDDDFFRAAAAGRARTAPEPQMTAATGDAEAGREVRLFAGASASPAEHGETDELDIPAFLRRSH